MLWHAFVGTAFSSCEIQHHVSLLPVTAQPLRSGVPWVSLRPGKTWNWHPPFPDFYPDSKMVAPKQIEVIFKTDKQREQKNKKQNKQKMMCTKWLVYYSLNQVDFSAHLKWRPGHVPPLNHPRYATALRQLFKFTKCIHAWSGVFKIYPNKYLSIP